MYDEFSSLNGIEAPIQDASWVGWFQKKLIAQFECTISAIGIIYWIAGAFAQIWIAKVRNLTEKCPHLNNLSS